LNEKKEMQPGNKRMSRACFSPALRCEEAGLATALCICEEMGGIAPVRNGFRQWKELLASPAAAQQRHYMNHVMQESLRH